MDLWATMYHVFIMNHVCIMHHIRYVSCIMYVSPQVLRSMAVPRSSCGLASLSGRLYVVGGNTGDDTVTGSVECYVPAMDTWCPCAPLGCSRSGLGLCAM